ncbi:glycosyltransferase [Pectobacterium fontis]|uniref:glycosyltransferase n=1 Tax=Pectobacterium fontis TaxID=2558042 RepID=UPI00068D3657|nr:glycosyltransferase [Pectobacterium fontis]
MPCVFISTHQLSDYQDEAFATADLIGGFLEQGWRVEVFCHRYDGVMKTWIEQQYGDGDLLITDDAEYVFDGEYDLLWLQYSVINNSLLARMLNGELITRIIFDHVALQNRESSPADVRSENQLADAALISVPRLKQYLLEAGVESQKISVFPQPLSDSFYGIIERSSSSLKKLLIVTDTLTSELQALPARLAELSIACDLVSKREWLQQPTAWADYDVAIASGRIAQYMLCAGMPVYLHDDGKFRGYVNSDITENNVFREETTARVLSLDELVAEIANDYSIASHYVKHRASFYQQHWRCSNALNALLETLPDPSLKIINDQELQRWALHNQTLLDKTKPSYSVAEWLDQRSLTPARSTLLQAYIHNTPELGNIAIAVLDIQDNTDSNAVATSLASIRGQIVMPSECYVISRHAQGCDDNVVWLTENNSRFEALNQVVSQSMASFLLVLTAGDRLLPQTLLLLAEYRLRFPAARAFYFDEAEFAAGEAKNPILKPACNIDMLRSYPYIGRNLALDMAALHQLGGIAADYSYFGLLDCIYRFIEQEGPQSVARIPEVLVYAQQTLSDWSASEMTRCYYPQVLALHLARCHVNAEIHATDKAGLWRVGYRHDTQPLVSIIIPTRDHLVLISRCIETLMENTRYPRYELLIIDHQSTEPGAKQYLSQLSTMGFSQIRVLTWEGEFNFSAINNFAAEEARGDVLLFLNNDTEIIDGEWLDAMLQHVLRPEVGIVGAKLEYQDGRIQHGGMVLGLSDSAGIVFQGHAADASGYMNRLLVTHNVSAVSASCMMMRREVFISLGGFDAESFPTYFGDVDLGVKAGQQGYLVVWTPEARVMHLGGASRLLQRHFHLPPLPQRRDVEALYQYWLPQLADDPSYHPSYGKHAPGFSLTPKMARCQLPLPGRPLPVVLANHVDWHGCGHYRVMFPFQALSREMHIEGGITHGMADLVDVVHQAPDVIIAQLSYGPQMAEVTQRYHRYTNAKVVAEFDDYVLNIPINSGNRKNFSQERIKNFRRAMESVDWLVVSTPALAEAYSRYHHDIRVAYNRLPAEWWKGLTSLRRQGKKLRVGWAGGSSHRGDLAILRSVVKALEDEVEWVFMGMKPEGVKCEFHAGVPIEYYPQKTASLNLDLALVPLEHNQFNECKSNLRLLELGACGIPVICTDIEPYRCGLPVTRVGNRFKDWMDAIRMHLADMDATEKMGDQLREAVYQDWILEGQGLSDWQRAWLPK